MSAHENLTIVFTDIVGYSALTSQLTRVESLRLLRRHDTLLHPIVRSYRGRRIKNIGDAMLLVFKSPTDAIHCGMAMQDALAVKRARDSDWDNLHIRVAVNLGEVRLERNDVFGEPVNITARLEGITPADEVWFTEAVYLAMNKAEVPSDFVGEHQLKGIPEPIRVYRVPPYSATRLVGSGEPYPEQAALPFDGAHLRRKPVNSASQFMLRPARQFWDQGHACVDSMFKRTALEVRKLGSKMPRHKRAIGLLAPLLVLISAAALLLAWPAPQSLRQAETNTLEQVSPPNEIWLKTAEEALAQGNLEQLEILLQDRGEQADALVIRGHLAFENNQPGVGANLYGDALKSHSSLARDSLMAMNLVSILPQETALDLLTAHASPEMLDALAWYSGQPGFYRRTEAINLLRQMGMQERINWYGHYIEELRGRSQCKDRLLAIQALRKLGNPSAIPEIEQAIGEGLRAWWKNRCLREAARSTIEHLQKAQR